ncbi:MAG TPA: hypothetical protein VEN81_14535 [Planctomycetota bacterium]|nr:hypothetical protein [Planctomycetota bacterium]
MDLAKRFTLGATLWIALGSPVLAQSLEEKLDKKLASDFLKKAAWITDYDKAREESKKSGKAIFGYFSRSYAP